MTIHEQVLVRLLVLLINFIGKKVEGYYSWELKEAIKKLMENNNAD